MIVRDRRELDNAKYISDNSIKPYIDVETTGPFVDESKPTKMFWGKKMKRNTEKKNNNIVVIFLTMKNTIECYQSPITLGKIIIIKNKLFEYDSRCLFSTKVGSKYYNCLIVKEIDRLPINNMNTDEIKARGDSTLNDEFLLKMALRALSEEKKKMQIPLIVWILLAAAAIGLIAWFVISGGDTSPASAVVG